MLVHGFTQTAASWEPLVPLLEQATGLPAEAVDVPGHGTRSEQGDLDLWAGAEVVAAEAGRGVWIGYSLGGRLSLHVALARPELVDALVMVGATPGLRSESERAARREGDDALARRLEQIGVEEFVDEWLDNPLFAGLSAERAGRELRVANTVAGLAGSLRHAGTGTQDDLWPRLGELAMPVLCVAGERDARFAAIAEDMAAAIGPTASVAIVPGAGHTVHLEQPQRFVARVQAFLQAL